MAWVSVAVTAASAIYKGVTGSNQKNEGEKIIKEAGDGIPAGAVTAASEGMPAEQYAQSLKNINQNQATAIAKAQDRRLGLAAIGGIQNNTNNAVAKLDANNAIVRQKNQQRLLAFQDKAFQRKYGYGMQLMGAGNTNVSSGFDDLASGVGSAAYRGAFSKKGSNSLVYGSNAPVNDPFPYGI